MTVDPARLEVVRSGLSAAAREMGAALTRTAFSPNIKERRDHSSALFDAGGRLAAQAEHIPVHLGAMPAAVAAAVDALGPLEEGDAVALNDPYQGGTHLPDVTVLSPVWAEGTRVGYAANRAHHADLGGAAPGTMAPGVTDLEEEGLVLEPVLIQEGGEPVEATWERILGATRTPEERRGDLRAQLAANHVGRRRVRELAARRGPEAFGDAVDELLDVTESRARRVLSELPDGTYEAEDLLESDGVTSEPAPIRAAVTVDGSDVGVDFAGTADERPGNVNAPLPVARAAAYYVVRAVTDPDLAANAGCYRPVTVEAPEGCLLNPTPGRAVAAGNVETSQRVVDVLLEALAEAAPEDVVAGCQGTMNNVAIGGEDREGEAYAYYETIGGGGGGRPAKPGVSGRHSHMTNTRNTPVEALEHAYPLRARAYRLREGSGGDGAQPGGLGVVRAVEVVAGEPTLSLVTERRTTAPPGLFGGGDGAPGRNLLVRDGEERSLPAKVQLGLEVGDVVVVETPGGGGYGAPGDGS